MKNNLEVVKTVLIHWLNQKLLRKYAIDEEISRLSHMDDSKLDMEIIRLEKVVKERLCLLDKIRYYNERKQDRIHLSNLKIQKGLILRLRNQKIDDLLQEKEELAYNEYNYSSRIEEISSITKIEDLSLTEDELDLLKRILPQGSFLSGIPIVNNNKR